MVEKCVSFNFGKLPQCDGKNECALLHEDLVSKANVLSSSGNYDYFSLNVSMGIMNYNTCIISILVILQ